MLRILPLLLMAWVLAPAAIAQAQASRTALQATDTVPAGPDATPAVYHTAEVMPAFPGGPEEFGKFLRQKLQYPDEALRRGASGKVYVSFVVDERGRIQDPQVVKGLGYGLDQEALRLVRIMPWWTPGQVGGQPVKVAYTLPIIFRALE